MKRFNIGIHHKNGIGIPGEMVEHPQGQYVLHADVAELERQLEAVGAGGVSPLMGGEHRCIEGES